MAPVRLKWRVKQSLYGLVCLSLSVTCMGLLLLTELPVDLTEWTAVIRKRTSSSIDTTDYDDYAYDVQSLAKRFDDLAFGATTNLSSLVDEVMHESALTCIRRSVVNLDKDILHFNIQEYLGGIARVQKDDNRVLYKMQHSQLYGAPKCVIRIAKYCSTRCSHFIGNFSTEWHRFSCPGVTSCQVETRFVSLLTPDIMSSTDILIIVGSLHERLHLEELMASRPPGQLWMFYSRESPQHDPEYAPPQGTPNPYNLTMTYMPISDMYFPYCHYNKQAKSRFPPLPKKTKLMAWMASNCHRLSWRRNEIVEQLQKHLPIDTYGKCGTLGKLNEKEARETLGQYKFYLSLENSECRDYITEKMWRTSLPNGIVPIVYGASRRDYERIAPPNSFIHLEDFVSMKEFVDYIRALDADDERYNEFFAWRERGAVECHSARFFIMMRPEVNFCFLLRKVVHLHKNPETSWQQKVPDFKSWWTNQCSNTSQEKKVLGFDVHQPKRKKTKSRVQASHTES
ncbi:3-galactosyl-N-acetylglucosaminide 4-alpha-L-fucosyltransferase FUT3-like [Diadema antillarum]|uniref:3-galactosyl-N-acetylglucosaminide 4-alpha-L-fucosyltransferase FUT3-like n=1 Tax=Diadema antillarum TaxID=105358 RepID=UPI003A8803ED